WELTPAQRLSSQSSNEQSNDCFVQLIQSGNSLIPTFSAVDKLNGMEFRLFDVNGQLIQSQTVTDSSPIQIKNNLSAGEFFAVLSIHTCYALSLGDGSDGSPNISGVVNTYTAVTDITSANCSSQITVISASSFQVNDLVLIIQMEGAIIDSTNTSSYGTVN